MIRSRGEKETRPIGNGGVEDGLHEIGKRYTKSNHFEIKRPFIVRSMSNSEHLHVQDIGFQAANGLFCTLTAIKLDSVKERQCLTECHGRNAFFLGSMFIKTGDVPSWCHVPYLPLKKFFWCFSGQWEPNYFDLCWLLRKDIFVLYSTETYVLQRFR